MCAYAYLAVKHTVEDLWAIVEPVLLWSGVMKRPQRQAARPPAAAGANAAARLGWVCVEHSVDGIEQHASSEDAEEQVSDQDGASQHSNEIEHQEEAVQVKSYLQYCQDFIAHALTVQFLDGNRSSVLQQICPQTHVLSSACLQLYMSLLQLIKSFLS